MIKSIVIDDINDREKKCHEWDAIVKNFPDFDVYSLSGYTMPFAVHGDGLPLLIYYESAEFCAYSVHMLRKINSDALRGDYYDITSPYGYGGWHIKGNYSTKGLKSLHNEFMLFLAAHNVVCSFVRYTPLCDNFIYDKNYYDISFIGKTIEMNLTSYDLIWDNISSKNRNTIRKAINNGITIEHKHNDLELLGKFKKMYDDTMLRDNADNYYFFPSDFYDSLDCCLSDNYELFYAIYREHIIAMSIILFANDSIHYHLSCSLFEYRNLAPSNLLLYEVAKWGCEKGFKYFHLGGGLGGNQDSLYKFKAAFNRNSDCSFYIGKLKADEDIYNLLVKERSHNNTQFNIESSFFPLYRL